MQIKNFFSEAFTTTPFTFVHTDKQHSLSTREKTIVIAITFFTGILSLGLIAPLGFFISAKYFRERNVTRLNQEQIGIKENIPRETLASSPPKNDQDAAPIPSEKIHELPKIPKNFQMTQHLFEPKEVSGGRLYYKGDIPILEIAEGAPYERGLAHGELVAPYIGTILKQLVSEGVIPAHIDAKEMEKRKKTISQEHLDEFRGIIKGYETWAEKCPTAPKTLSLDQLVALHLIPDALHYKVPGASNDGIGCTVIVSDKGENLVVGRNLDWASHEVFGPFTLLQVFKRPNNETIFSVGAPGFIGFTSAFKIGQHASDVMAVFMNVCSGSELNPGGQMAVLHNRNLLEKCANIEDVKTKIHDEKPLGAYHATFVGQKNAASIHFEQGEGRTHYVREKKQEEPLVVTNWRYSKKGQSIDVMSSGKREETIRETFKDQTCPNSKKTKTGIEKANGAITIQSMYFNTQKKTLKLAFDNSHAGGKKRQKVDLSQFFT